MKKIYPDAATALKDIVKDGQTIAIGVRESDAVRSARTVVDDMAFPRRPMLLRNHLGTSNAQNRYRLGKK